MIQRHIGDRVTLSVAAAASPWFPIDIPSRAVPLIVVIVGVRRNLLCRV